MNLGAIKMGPARQRYEDVREPTFETDTFRRVSGKPPCPREALRARPNVPSRGLGRCQRGQRGPREA